ncbi:hypothetical protein SLA2020_503200 [Shorea laevis]
MGSMNSNSWPSFPFSPTHPSFPTHLHTFQPHQFNLGVVNGNMENSFQPQEWNLINTHKSEEVPKVADFLGISKSENYQSLGLVAINEIHQGSDFDYSFQNNSVGPVENVLVTANDDYELQENANKLQSQLTLSMGSGKGSTCETSADTTTNTTVEAAHRRTSYTFGQRTSIYRGVTRHRWTGRYEAHLWDNSCRTEGHSRKGRQGGYDKEEKAARAYDLTALKYWGPSTTTNFPISNYEKELEEMKHMTRQEFVAAIKRKSSGFSRGASMYRGVTRHHQHGRWQARIGQVAGNKDLYLGTYSTEEEAAQAYDIAAIKFRGLNAITNFDMNQYDVNAILENNTLPIRGAAKRLKEAKATESSREREEMIALGSSFQYGNSSSGRPQSYPPFQTPYDQLQHLLTLQNHEISQYAQDTLSFHHNYIQTQLQLHQHYGSYLHQSGQNSQFYTSYIQSNPDLLHGLMTMGGSSNSVVENNWSSSGSYSGRCLGMDSNSTAGNAVESTEEIAVVKVDYDMPSGGYGCWSGESVQGSNTGVFTTWNE